MPLTDAGHRNFWLNWPYNMLLKYVFSFLFYNHNISDQSKFMEWQKKNSNWKNGFTV